MSRPATQATAKAALIVLTKAPVPGLVKTRLCPPATPEQAAELAAAAMLDVLDVVRAVPQVHPMVALAGQLTGAARAAEIIAAMATMTRFSQRGDGLGARIVAAHHDAAALMPGRSSFQISTDTPQVDAALLAECVTTVLDPAVDAVLGPATDGGWWALGLRDPRAAGPVAEVPMSRADTGERTIAALRNAGLRVVLLPELTDVDTASDIVTVAEALAATVPGSRFAAAARALLGDAATLEPGHSAQR
ncbi:MAG: TIGR04282 family arsenosugar biosynthesis glycosyltransferase [Pseudonocardia sp.]